MVSDRRAGGYTVKTYRAVLYPLQKSAALETADCPQGRLFLLSIHIATQYEFRCTQA